MHKYAFKYAAAQNMHLDSGSVCTPSEKYAEAT